MKIETWNIEEMTGYKPISTFYEDFSIADMFGVNAVKDTYKRAMASWKNDYKMLTELVMVLNWKIWRWYESNEFITNFGKRQIVTLWIILKMMN